MYATAHMWRLEDSFLEWIVSQSWTDRSEKDTEFRQTGLLCKHFYLPNHLGYHIRAFFKSQKMRFDSGLSTTFFQGFSG